MQDTFTGRSPQAGVAASCFAALALSLCGCGDKPAPALPPPVTPVSAPPTARPQQQGDAGAPPVAVQPPQSREAALKEIERDAASADPEVYLKTLTDLLNGWMMSRNSFPTNLDVFVKEKMIRKLPTPPPGKQLAVDRKAMKVILVDK